MPTLLLLASTGLLTAYVFSVKVYKIWYVAMVACAVAWAIGTPWTRGTLLAIAKETAFVGLYWVAIVLSAAFSGLPLTSHVWVAIDAIFLPTFVLFFTTAWVNDEARIERALRALVWVSILSAVAFWGPERIATRAWYILPFIPPLSVAAIYRDERIGYAEIAVVIVLMFMTGTRVPFVISLATTAISFLVLTPTPIKAAAARGAIAAGATAALGVAALALPATAEKMTFAYTRLTGMQTVGFTLSRWGNVQPEPLPRPTTSSTVAAPPQEPPTSPQFSPPTAAPDVPDDPVRVRIAALTKDLLSRGVSAFGIGYGNIERAYGARYKTTETFTAHNIYLAWLIEIGVFGCIVVALILGRFYWVCARHWPNWHFRCLAVSMTALLVNGLLHPIHHGPMLFILAGLCFGAKWREERCAK